MHLNVLLLVLLDLSIQTSSSPTPPVVPLTNALTAIYCHQSDEPGIMTIRCGPNEKIRMLDAFDATVRNKSRLPVQCLPQRTMASTDSRNSDGADCKVHTSFTSACSGRENCTLHMQRIRLTSPNDNCVNDLVDYTMAFFECISDAFIHDVCSSQVITSAWGTLKTPNFPNPYTSSDDCWCKLSTQFQHRLLLSIIVFQLIPYDQHCAGAGLYLQSSNDQRSTQCTYLQQGHNYLSDANTLYINFYSRTPTVRGGFWMIYEASHPNAEIHLQCGPREKLGVPSLSTLSPPVSTPFDHGWSRLAFNNPTTASIRRRMHLHSTVTTPHSSTHTNSKINSSTAVGAFNYPHGSLTTFELAYGPRGWYLKHPTRPANQTWVNALRPTSSPLPVVKWNFTWRYTRPSRLRTFTTTRSSLVFTTTLTPKRSTTTITTTTTKTTKTTTTTTTTVPTTSTTTQRSSTMTTERVTMMAFTKALPTTATTLYHRVLFANKPWIYISTRAPSTTVPPTIKYQPPSSQVPLTVTPTIPVPTPWYSPAGPFDWWQWQWYTTKSQKSTVKILSATQRSTRFSKATTTTTTSSTTTTTTTFTIATTTTTTTTRSTIRTTRTVTSITPSTSQTPAATTSSRPTTMITTMTTTAATSMMTTKVTTATTNAPLPTSTQSETTMDWFKWPYRESTVVRKKPSYNYEDEYRTWLEHLSTSEIQAMITSTSSDSTQFSTGSSQQYRQLSFTSTRPDWSADTRVVTVVTPPAKRQQASVGANERNPLGTQINERATVPNYHNMIRRVIEQRTRRTPMQYGWLSKTDMTIVAVSILFVILLAIINLILFAVRRHRHRLQGRHLLSSSMPSSFDDRRMRGNRHSHGGPSGDSTNSLIHSPNSNSNNDILPAVGEIVIWDEKDQGGYMIDNNGAWAKIEGRQWFGSNIFKSCTKTSLSKSFRSRFRFTRHSDKKAHSQSQPPITPRTHPSQQQAFKFPLLMDAATLSPVPEADDYESSDLSLSDVVIRSSSIAVKNPARRQQQQQPLIKPDRKQNLSAQDSQQATKVIHALVHADQQNSDDYYKRLGNGTDDSNYTMMPSNDPGESSTAEQETDRSLGNEINGGGSFLLSVQNTLKRDDYGGTMTDGTDSFYHPPYPTQPLIEYPNAHAHSNYIQPNNQNTGPFSTKPSISTFKPSPNHHLIVGHCQAEFQPLDPKLLFKSVEKISFSEHPQTFRCSQLTTYDSGFVDDQTIGSSTAATLAILGGSSDDDLLDKKRLERMSMDDILLTKSEDDEDDDDEDEGLGIHGSSGKRLRSANPQKWKNIAKRVSFQEEHVVQRFSPPLPSSLNASTNAELSTNIFDTYDMGAIVAQATVVATPPLKSLQPFASSIVIIDEPSSSIIDPQKSVRSVDTIDNEENTDNIIMNHLHSVKSLKKFFETKMVVQRPLPPAQPSSTTVTTPSPSDEQGRDSSMSIARDQRTVEDVDQRQEIMNKVLESLKRKKSYTRTTHDTPEPSGRCSAITSSSYDSNMTQNLAAHRHYSRRFRSSSTSNNSLGRGGNIITQINVPPSQRSKRAISQEPQYYQSTDHFLNNIDRWKQEHPRPLESDDDDNISESSMLWQARAKLNEFVTRTKKTHHHHHSSPYYSACIQVGTPSEDLYTFDDNESVTAETRF